MKQSAAISLEDLRRHIGRLVDRHDIMVTWCERPQKSWGAIDLEEICIAPIKSLVSYATALHEIGHIQGRFQRSRSLMVRERNAWLWAERNALLWTAAMEAQAAQSLKWYEDRIRVGKIAPLFKIEGVEFIPENGGGPGVRLRKP